MLVTNFASFDDQCKFQNHVVFFQKRAQILVADLWACFCGTGFGYFKDIDSAITMFADYRVPQCLYYFGVIKYSNHLLQILQSNTIIDSCSNYEIEIRSASIFSVELVREKVELLISLSNVKSDINLNSILIDFYLWDYAKSHSENMKHIPIHKTITKFY